MVAIGALVAAGSSPLTRGKRSSWASTHVVTWAHPRSRGENFSRPKVTPLLPGSSPLTRGKPQELANLLDDLGLIPAHAGKTRWPAPSTRSLPAHPRSRGENFGVQEDSGLIDGSSPLTRGKRDVGGVRASRRGLIPAHAGKTYPRRARSRPPAAHPRSRGENLLVGLDACGHVGSSPLTRGKLGSWSVARNGWGLIPAHAGKTFGLVAHAWIVGAHPRSRGENLVTTGSYDGNLGSSPLTRGKLAPAVLRPAALGLIPAHAGKTICHIGSTGRGRAHPRSRGENM